MSTSTDEMWKRDEAHIREAMARQASSAEAPVENAGPVSSFALARGSAEGESQLQDRFFCPSCRHDFDSSDVVFALPSGPAEECSEETPGRAFACPKCFYTFPEYY